MHCNSGSYKQLKRGERLLFMYIRGGVKTLMTYI